MSTIKSISRSFMRGPIYVILFGLIFFGIGGWMTFSQAMFRQDAVPVQGEVTGHAMGSCDEDGCTYKSVVDFQTLEGESVTYTTTFSSSPPAYDVGERVTIYYSPENPADAVIKGEGIVFRIVFMSVGGLIILGGLAFFGFNIKSSLLEEE